MRAFCWMAVLGAAAGCAEGGPDLEGTVADTGTAAASSPTSPGTTSTTAPPEPRWYAVGGTLALVGGEMVGGTLQLALYPDDPADGALCEASRAVVQATPVAPAPDPAVLGWWQVVTDGASAGCAGLEAVGNGLYLGLGALHPDVEALLDAYGMAGHAQALYGAYASFDDPGAHAGAEPTAWAFGFAARPQDVAGDRPAVEEPPLPDGSYDLTPVYVFDLASSLDLPTGAALGARRYQLSVATPEKPAAAKTRPVSSQ